MPAVWGFRTKLFAIADCVLLSPPNRVAVAFSPDHEMLRPAHLRFPY
jgi:hypothetical protein